MHVSSMHDASTTLLPIAHAFLFLVDVGLIKATIVIKQILIMIMYGFGYTNVDDDAVRGPQSGR